jgi:hypothetical protein
MKRQHWVIVMAIFVLASFSCAGNADRQKIRLIQAGDLFPETPLPTPTDPASRKYLGVLGENNFTLKEVGADLIVVEILSVHCPSCQRQSKAYNKLYDLIEKDPQTRDRIKMIGIAAGNSWAEVTHFIAQYNVRFPIIPDQQYHFYNAIGETRAPFTIYVRQQPGMPAAIVAQTHFGLNLQYMEVFDELKQILTIDVASIQNANSRKVAVQPIVIPVITKAELETRIKKLFADFGIIGIFIGFYGQKSNQTSVEKFRIEPDFVSLYDSLLFKLSDSFQNRRRGQSHLTSHLDVGNTGLFL